MSNRSLLSQSKLQKLPNMERESVNMIEIQVEFLKEILPEISAQNAKFVG